MISKRKSKKELPYFINDKSKYECKLCGIECTKQSNICKHFKNFHSINEQELSIFTYKGKPISLSTEKILIWKCSHGIPMAALCDKFLIDLLPPLTLKSDKTNQKILDEICEQIVNMNYSKSHGKSVSLVLDGGTVNHTKWLAIGFLYRTLEMVKFQILDVKVFCKATADDIKYEIDLIANRITHQYKGKVWAACTDNAQNFCKVFLDNKNSLDEDFIPLSMIRVSCSCHTIQLALKDLKKEDKYFRQLIKKMKTIPSKISFLTRKELQKLRITSFPPLQKQRWNSVFITLSYIITNVGSISSLFSLDEVGCFDMFELLRLQKELRPVYEFTTQCEKDDFNQADVYIEFRALESKLEVLNTNRSKKLLSLIRKRFTNTADLDLSRLCYFTTNAGIKEKRDHFPHISLANIDPYDQKTKKMYDDELHFIQGFEKTIKKICSKIKLNSRIVLKSFELMMNHYEPPDNDIHQFPSASDLERVISKYSSEKESYIDLAQFIEILQVLPSSEAGAERIFARMRDIYNKKQTRLSPKSLRSNLIVSFYEYQERPPDDDVKTDDWPPLEEEEEEEAIENDENNQNSE